MNITQIAIEVSGGRFVPGETVYFEVVITSVHGWTLYAEPVVTVNGEVIPGTYEKTIIPGASVSWPLSFVMPDKNAEIVAQCWCEAGDTMWGQDSSAKTVVRVSGGGVPATVLLLGAVGLGLFAMARKS